MKKLVCVGAIVRKKNRYLLGKRSPEKTWAAGKWDLVGGKAKRKEHMLLALYREVKEETGIEVRNAESLKVIDIPGESTIDAFEYHIFLVTHFKGKARNLSDEHTELKWFTASQLATLDLALPEYLIMIEKINAAS